MHRGGLPFSLCHGCDHTMPDVEQFEITGGARLTGEATVAGAKNSVLKVMAASLLASGTTRLTNVPDIGDVPIMGEVLRGLGAAGRRRRARTSRSPCRSRSGTRPTTSTSGGSAARSACSGRCSARVGRARVALPGGDAIGSRSLDLHIMGLERLGAVFDNAHGYLVAEAPRAARRADLAGLPERRRDREHHDGRGAGQGHDDDRQRRARARDRRPVPDAGRDGRPDRRDRHVDAGDRGRRGAAPDRPTTSSPTGSSPAPGRSRPP